MKLAGNKKKILFIYASLVFAAAAVFGVMAAINDGSLFQATFHQENKLEKKVKEKADEPVSAAVQGEMNFLQNLKDRTYKEAAVFQEGAENEVLNIISKQHSYLNNLVGFGGADVFKADYVQTSTGWIELKEDIVWLREKGFAESNVWNDMDRARALMLVTIHYEDTMSLRYLHRIFHDLDVELNGYSDKDKKYWNVTDAFGKNGDKIQNHLNGAKAE
ncbi:hypothetical protein ACFQPF_00755 [Fictibacillus iocasae]|uniref:Uncharacterized protein n=1 Tax=Fictibacillus iocasae TaxID=2715437 RepID=A0ABW2NKX1_9BACL